MVFKSNLFLLDNNYLRLTACLDITFLLVVFPACSFAPIGLISLSAVGRLYSWLLLMMFLRFLRTDSFSDSPVGSVWSLSIFSRSSSWTLFPMMKLLVICSGKMDPSLDFPMACWSAEDAGRELFFSRLLIQRYLWNVQLCRILLSLKQKELKTFFRCPLHYSRSPRPRCWWWSVEAETEGKLTGWGLAAGCSAQRSCQHI